MGQQTEAETEKPIDRETHRDKPKENLRTTEPETQRCRELSQGERDTSQDRDRDGSHERTVKTYTQSVWERDGNLPREQRVTDGQRLVL